MEENVNESDQAIDAIIAKVTEIRKNNNVQWMEILRIALKYAPLQTSQILSDILENDKHVVKTMSGAVKIGKMELDKGKSDKI